MAINKKLIHFKALDSFKNSLNSGQILDTSIVFIQDAKLIWTHGQYYGNVDEILERLTTVETTLVDLNENKANKVLSEDFTPSVFPEDTGNKEYYSLTAQESLESAIGKLDSNIVTLVNAILENEEVTALAYTKISDTVNLIPSQYSEDPQLQYKSLGGNEVYEKLFSLEYTTPGSEATWELQCTSETSGVVILGLNCILKQVLGEEGVVSFDYRDQYLFEDNTNDLKYYYKHSSGSIVIKFTSSVNTTLTGTILFSSASVISGGNSTTVSNEEIIDGGGSI